MTYAHLLRLEAVIGSDGTTSFSFHIGKWSIHTTAPQIGSMNRPLEAEDW